MSIKLESFNKTQLRGNLPDIRPGDIVRIHQKISGQGGSVSGKKEKDKGKEKTQIFEGLVIAKKHGKGVSATITVRKVMSGVGVERIFPIHSPIIIKIEIIRKSSTRRAKLYYMRTAKGKRARLKREEFGQAVAPEPETNEVIEEKPAKILETDTNKGGE